MMPHAQHKPPWNPSQIAWICILFGAFPGVWLWVVNGRRLSLVLPLITRIIVGASIAIYILTLMRLLWVPPGSPFGKRFQLLNVVMNLIVAWQLFASQRASFARHRREGGAMASGWVPLFAGIVGFLLILGLSIGTENVRVGRDYREFDLALAQMDKGPAQTRQAETFFRNFARNYPEEPMTHWNLAIIYTRRERIEQAKLELQAMLALEPENKEAYDFLRELQSQK